MQRVGLVLGAGGIVGQAWHAGVLQALHEQGFDPAASEVVVGTSAGSLVGGMLRRGLSVRELGDGSYRRGAVGGRAGARPTGAGLAATAERAVQAAARTSGRPRMGSRIAGMVPRGRVSPGGIVRLVQLVGGDDWPDETTWICAVQRRTGARVVFGSDGAPPAPFSKAIAASCAIPGYFQPVRIPSGAVNGKSDGTPEARPADVRPADDYVDGGAHSPTNLDLLAGAGLDAVLALSPMSFSGVPSARLDLGARALFRGTLAREALAVRRRGTPVLTFAPGAAELRVMGLNAMSPARWADVVEIAAASARKRLQGPEAASVLASALG
jgi:NTE family protein